MPKNKVKKDDKIIKFEKEILSETLEDNSEYTLTFGIPGRGKIKIKILKDSESLINCIS